MLKHPTVISGVTVGTGVSVGVGVIFAPSSAFWVPPRIPFEEYVSPLTVSIPSTDCFSRIAGCNTFHAFLKKESVSVFVFVSSIIFPSLIVTVI